MSVRKRIKIQSRLYFFQLKFTCSRGDTDKEV